MFLIDLKGEWWNVDQITKIEPFRPQGAEYDKPGEIAYVVTLSSGHERGITEKEFRKIMAKMDSQ